MAMSVTVVANIHGHGNYHSGVGARDWPQSGDSTH